MSLRLEYADKYRLWSDLIQGNADRVFIPTDERPKLGSRVPVELALVGLAAHVVIIGTVVGVRGASERFHAGAYIRFPTDEIDKCRKFLGLVQAPERYEHGRKARRIPCALQVRFRQPAVAEHGMAHNISETGLLVSTPVELSAGQYVELDLVLDDESVLPLRAEVSREGNQNRWAALRFLEPPPEVFARIQQCLERLSNRVLEGGAKQSSVVVADDEASILEFLGKALSRYGYQVHKANRGEDALHLIRELRPKMVILDILMPGLDGVDVCKMMRADIDMAEIPVIFISALDDARLHNIADEAGATDYLTKPVELADLINVVGRYLKA